MEKRTRLWIIGSLSGLLVAFDCAFNIIFAINVGEEKSIPALQAILYVALVFNLTTVVAAALYGAFLLSKLNEHVLGSRVRAWSIFTGTAAIAFLSSVVSCVALVWVVTKAGDLRLVLNTDPAILAGAGLGVWGVSTALQIALYVLCGYYVRDLLQAQRASRLDMVFRARAPSMSTIGRPETHRTNRSFGSEEPTLHSPPRTPVSRKNSFTPASSSTKVGHSSTRTRFTRYSNRSSVDVVPFPAGEAMSIDSAFDSWDTSSVHQEMRNAIHSSPPVTRAGLPTIPGSRPGSAVLDAMFLPESPLASSPPHAATSDTATAVGWGSSPRTKSSRPSSPVNFSRPTSRPTSSHASKAPPPPMIEESESSLQTLIHPLFRSTSPHPPPIVAAGSMVTASPLANSTMTPRTLARLRTNSNPGTGYWKAMPSIDRSDRNSVHQSLPDSPTLGSVGTPGIGSPGPSIADEAELPPILPGFVLSAGQRSSLVGYGKRKSVKHDRAKSQVSAGSRVSQ